MKSQKEFFEFIKSSPSPYHTVATVEKILQADGYVRLYENEQWSLAENGKYYVVRNGSSLIAFRGKKGPFMICASHSDSPTFKVKDIIRDGDYCKIATEKYGGMIMYSWLDRPLSIAGRVVLREGERVRVKLFNPDYDLAVIPSLAIHMKRDSADLNSLNPAVDMLPICNEENLNQLIAKELCVKTDAIISHDLSLCVRDASRQLGEYILSPRLDDLECVWTSLRSFLLAKESSATPVFALFDNEEVGSQTENGASSDFLSATLYRISEDAEKYYRMLSESFLVSADNAHAKHPNHPELADKCGAPLMNGGIVIKYNANRSYTTDAVSSAIFEEICKRAGVKTQKFYNRADMRGGSTLGAISDTKVSLLTVDIGLAQLGMHSAVETAGAYDIDDMITALTAFYSTRLKSDSGEIEIK